MKATTVKKISLKSAAQKRGDSVDYLLATAEAELIDIFARIEPFDAFLMTMRGELMPTIDRQGNPVPIIEPRNGGGMSYTTLLPHEIGFLRAGRQLTVKILREEGFENGISFPSLGDEKYLFYLTEPQTIGIDQLFINEENKCNAAEVVK